MHRIAAAYCDRCHTYIAWSVCVFITWICPAETAESIEIPFGGLTHLGPRKFKEPCIRWGQDRDESVRSREGWQVGDAAFCQITLDTHSLIY